MCSGTIPQDATLPQLEKGLRTLGRELSERTGQLKLLIRNNFERFINCKDAIDDIHSKLRKMLMQGGAGAAGGSGGTAGGRTGSVTAQQQGVGTERVIRQLEQVRICCCVLSGSPGQCRCHAAQMGAEQGHLSADLADPHVTSNGSGAR